MTWLFDENGGRSGLTRAIASSLPRSDSLTRGLRNTMRRQDFANCSDGRLLSEFAEQQDRAALTELVGRHHRIVLGVCRSMLGNTADADDAYQATFLVLVRNAHKIRKSQALGSWLYGVAYRVSLRTRQKRARWRTETLEEPTMPTHTPLDTLTQQDQQASALDAIKKLPESLRLPVVMRYLHDKSNQQVANELAISESAVEGRLKRAKKRLRSYLIRQGLTLSLALATFEWMRNEASAATELVDSTVALCNATIHPTSSTTSDGTRPTSNLETADVTSTGIALQLTQEELKMMAAFKLSKLAVVGCLGLATASVYLTTTLTAANAHERGRNGTRQGGVVATRRVGHTAASTPTVVVAQATPSGDALFGASDALSGSSSANNPFDSSGSSTESAEADPFGASSVTSAPRDSNSDPFAASPNTASNSNSANTTSSSSSNDAVDVSGMAGTTTANSAPPNTPRRLYSNHEYTAAEERFKRELDRPTRVEFYDEPLSSAVSYLQELHGLQMTFDTLAFDEAGMSSDQAVNLHAQGVTLRSALNMMTRQLGMAYTLRDEMIVITSPDDARENLQVRVYHLDNFSFVADSKTLPEMLQRTIAPDSWSETGGNGAITLTEVASGNSSKHDVMVIRQTFDVHEQIEKLLRQLDQPGDNAANVSGR